MEKLSETDKKIIAEILEEEFLSGVFETFYYLEQFEIEPFIGGYEGSPHEDFIGRVAKEDTWKWPVK